MQSLQRISAILLSCIIVVIISCKAQDTVNADLVNSKVIRTIDLASHLPKISTQVTLENTGKSAARSFLVAVDPDLTNHVFYIGATLKASGEEDRKLTVAKTSIAANKDVQVYRVELPGNGLEAGKEASITVDTVFGHALLPYPAQITQSEKQYVKFLANVYHYSPYTTKTQTTTVTCASSTIDFYTKEKPVNAAEKTITYGPYENVTPFKQVEMMVHFENNSPFLTVTHMTRLIEVSHWGNIAIEETYDLLHSGAVLKGSFSRYDYQRAQDGISSVKSFKTLLPAAARDVYYRDEIGNISTSHLRDADDGIELEIRPRFPLFGGWKTHYYIGYNVPSYQYLYNKGDHYALVVKFVDHVFDDQVIDHITVKVILPEGARDVQLKAPYDVVRDKDEVMYTYLDTMGRPVIIMHKDNLVEQHIQDFKLHYVFAKYMLLQEPMLVVTAFFLLFTIVIIYVRLDFSISKDEASESRMRTASLVEQVQAAQDRRSALYQSYEDAINKFKLSKDLTVFSANRKKIDSDHKQLTQQIATLQTKLKTEGSDAADKVLELQKCDAQVRDQLNLAIQFAERLVSGKMNKTQYLEGETGVRAKRDEFCAKMDSLLAAL